IIRGRKLQGQLAVDALTVSLTKHIGHLLRNAVDIVIGGLVLHVAHSHTAPSPVNMLFATPVHVHTTANATPAGTSGSSGGATLALLVATGYCHTKLAVGKGFAVYARNLRGQFVVGGGIIPNALDAHGRS